MEDKKPNVIDRLVSDCEIKYPLFAFHLSNSLFVSIIVQTFRQQ